VFKHLHVSSATLPAVLSVSTLLAQNEHGTIHAFPVTTSSLFSTVTLLWKWLRLLNAFPRFHPSPLWIERRRVYANPGYSHGGSYNAAVKLSVARHSAASVAATVSVEYPTTPT
jgi:hypothetical protein